MNSKDRAYLRGLAMNIEPAVIIGKNGIGENLVKQVDDLLEARELVKLSVLRNSDFTAKQLIDAIAEETGAEAVQAVGNKITLYRRSHKDGIKHILD